MDQDISHQDDEHSMNAVRDLLFGKKNQEISNRFDSLENSLLESMNRIEERMNGRMDSIDQFVKGELDAVRSIVHSSDDRLRSEVENRKSEVSSINDFVGAIDSKTEDKFRSVHESLDHLGHKSREELHGQVDDLRAELDAIRDEFRQRVSNEIEKLSASAAHRSDISGFLIDLGMKYQTRDNETPHVEDMNEGTVELHS